MNEVIFAVRSNFLEVPGGDTTQILKTKEYLEEIYKLKIHICTSPSELKDYPKAKIVHIFDMHEHALKYFTKAKELLKNIALSTIYWDLTHAVYVNTLVNKFNIFPNNRNYYKNKNLGVMFANLLKKIFLKKKYYMSSYYKKTRKKLILEADILLPNSPEEINIVTKQLGISSYTIKSKTFSVPNAFDSQYTNTQDNIQNEKISQLDNFVLQVARIEPIKNQLNTVNALMDCPEIPIVFVGSFRNKKYKNYYKLLKAQAEKRGNVYFIDQVPHGEIYSYYKKASVHVLPSFRESTGLSSLEALATGCEIVVSSEEYCPVEYYEFNKYGHLCNPYCPKSIKQAILNSFENRKNIIDKNKYLEKFSYEATARETYRAYCSLNVLL